MGIRRNFESDGGSFNIKQCSFCGSTDWQGYWLHHELVLVCHDCALNLLPALFADATRTPNWRPLDGEKELLLFEKSYWRTQAVTGYHNSIRGSIIRKSESRK
jgi:hypothetical protein